MTYDPLIKFAPIIVPVILAASIIAVTIYRLPAMPRAGHRCGGKLCVD